ncbi:MAG TPA: hypothetical protein VEX69_04445 [Candidatus Limnocylindria bacterium]|nr:hypothetical protein [Candidatus Limnocylindria bacterium]
MDPGDSSHREDRSRLPVALAAGAAVVLLLFGGLMLVSRMTRTHGPAAADVLPFGAAEQTYAQRIHFLNPQMARATNFLNQEFTYIAGTISNDGTRSLQRLQATLEFHDPLNQVVLRETQLLITSPARPLDGGQRRDFQVTLDHVPATWDQQYPSIRVSGIVLGE